MYHIISSEHCPLLADCCHYQNTALYRQTIVITQMQCTVAVFHISTEKTKTLAALSHENTHSDDSNDHSSNRKHNIVLIS